jgi:hypothetical protein
MMSQTSSCSFVGNTRTSDLSQPLVILVGDDPEQLVHTIASDRCDDAKLRKMSPDRIDHLGLLADKRMTGAVKCQVALLLGGLGRDEPGWEDSTGRSTRERKPPDSCVGPSVYSIAMRVPVAPFSSRLRWKLAR